MTDGFFVYKQKKTSAIMLSARKIHASRKQQKWHFSWITVNAIASVQPRSIKRSQRRI